MRERKRQSRGSDSTDRFLSLCCHDYIVFVRHEEGSIKIIISVALMRNYEEGTLSLSLARTCLFLTGTSYFIKVSFFYETSRMYDILYTVTKLLGKLIKDLFHGIYCKIVIVYKLASKRLFI